MSTYLGTGAYTYTAHARQRMAERRITDLEVDTVLNYGRVIYKKGARTFTVGRQEVRVLPLAERQRRSTEGIQVIVSADNYILSVCRNRDVHKLRLIADAKPRQRRSRSVGSWSLTESRPVLWRGAD